MSVWLPVDYAFSSALTKRRLLEIPTIVEMPVHHRHKAYRLSFWFLVHWDLIIDFKLHTLRLRPFNA